MKRTAAIAVVVAAAVALSGCGVRPEGSSINERHDKRYYACIEAGGSWVEDGWGESCLMPEVSR